MIIQKWIVDTLRAFGSAEFQLMVDLALSNEDFKAIDLLLQEAMQVNAAREAIRTYVPSETYPDPPAWCAEQLAKWGYT